MNNKNHYVITLILLIKKSKCREGVGDRTMSEVINQNWQRTKLNQETMSQDSI